MTCERWEVVGGELAKRGFEKLREKVNGWLPGKGEKEGGAVELGGTGQKQPTEIEDGRG